MGEAMTNPWKDLVATVEFELLRLSQEVDGRHVLPNTAHVRAPERRFEPLTPVLEAATGEVGAALAAWARERGHGWYRDLGPFLTIELAGGDVLEVACGFARAAPAE